MSLFKSNEERRIEREIKVRQGIRRIEKAIREQSKFSDEFIAKAREAKGIGDIGQYKFLCANLKKCAGLKRLLERQLLAVKSAVLVKRQAEASSDFSEAMNTMSSEIARMFGATDLTKTQAQWEKAVAQSNSMQERADLFLGSLEEDAQCDDTSAEAIGDEEIEAMIQAKEDGEQAAELKRLGGLKDELEALKGGAERADIK